jgi:proteic killer suppression protein
MIRSYRDKRTERFTAGEMVPRFEPFRRQAEKRLRILEAATTLGDLRGLPGNRLETLKGKRRGEYSIRINDRWRICFTWPRDADGPEDVEIVDYH